MKFTIKEIANFANVSIRTMYRRLNELKEDGKFKKQSKGLFLSEDEAQQIADILGFKIKKFR